MAPVAVVTTDGTLRMTPFVAARSIVAPDTEAFPLVNAKTVNVFDEVPSAFNTPELALIMMDATFAFGAGVTTGELAGARGDPLGVPALPPPPPQAVSVTATARQKT